MLQPVHPALLGAASLAYLQAAAAYLLLIAARRPRFGRWASIGLLTALAAHTLALLVAWLESGRPILGAEANTLAYYAWLTVAIYLALERLVQQKALGAIVAPLACIGVLAAIPLPPQQHPTLAPFAGSLWLPFHVGVSFASYAALSVAFGSALLYLLQERQLKSRRLRAFLLHLPPLGTLDLVTYRLMEVGFLLLTATILIGGAGVQQAWGTPGSGSPSRRPPSRCGGSTWPT